MTSNPAHNVVRLKLVYCLNNWMGNFFLLSGAFRNKGKLSRNDLLSDAREIIKKAYPFTLIAVVCDTTQSSTYESAIYVKNPLLKRHFYMIYSSRLWCMESEQEVRSFAAWSDEQFFFNPSCFKVTNKRATTKRNVRIIASCTSQRD